MSNFMKRTISGICMILIILATIYKGDYFLATFTLLISLIGINEFYNSLKFKDIKSLKYIGFLYTILVFFNNIKLFNIEDSFIIFISMMLIFLNLIFKKDFNLKDAFSTIFGILYIPFLFNHIFLLNKTKYIWLIFITAWGTDTFAYLTGKIIGKHKLYPSLSPNKTIEGSLGGILGSVILSILYGKYIGIYQIINIIIISIICSIFSQLGDLTASRIKRITNIKDFGYIIPGHGGILDRFDSILFTAPIVYYCINYIL